MSLPPATKSTASTSESSSPSLTTILNKNRSTKTTLTIFCSPATDTSIKSSALDICSFFFCWDEAVLDCPRLPQPASSTGTDSAIREAISHSRNLIYYQTPVSMTLRYCLKIHSRCPHSQWLKKILKKSAKPVIAHCYDRRSNWQSIQYSWMNKWNQRLGEGLQCLHFLRTGDPVVLHQ